MGVPEGGILAMRLVMLMGGCTVGRAAGLATAWAVVAQLPAWGLAGVLSSAPGPVVLG